MHIYCLHASRKEQDGTHYFMELFTSEEHLRLWLKHHPGTVVEEITGHDVDSEINEILAKDAGDRPPSHREQCKHCQLLGHWEAKEFLIDDEDVALSMNAMANLSPTQRRQVLCDHFFKSF